MIHDSTQSILDMLNTSYGPCGLDKMCINDKEALITNDGATILKNFQTNPIHKIISSVSDSQDVNCGDGTTSVVLLLCAIVNEMMFFKHKDVHPSKITKGLRIAKELCLEYLNKTKLKVDDGEFIPIAATALSSKITAFCSEMAKVANDAVTRCKKDRIRILKNIGGSVSDIKMYKSILLGIKVDLPAEFTKRRMSILQFSISPPKTHMDFEVEIQNYEQMEKFVNEEKEYVIKRINKLKEAGVDLIVMQKNLMRESISELAHHYLEENGIKVIKNVDRDDIAYLCETLKMKPISDIDLVNEPKEVSVRNIDDCMIEIEGYGTSIVVTGCNQMVVDEAERNLQDAISVVACLKKDLYIVPGGCSIETGMSKVLESYVGDHSMIVRRLSKALIALPHFLSSNMGLNSIEIVTNLKKSMEDYPNLGISISSRVISDMIVDDIITQPAEVFKSMIVLAFETAEMLLKIDDKIGRAHV